MGRYGFGVLMFFAGALVLWATTGFKNPWRGMGNGTPKEGAACMTADNKNGTIKAGVCVAA